MPGNKKPPTPLEDVRWHVQMATLKLAGWWWIGAFWNVREARGHLEQARLALHAHEEQAGAQIIKK